MVELPADDLRKKNVSWRLVQSPPRGFISSIHWLQTNVTSTNVGTISTSSLTENNYVFQLYQLNAVSSIAALFDQYCIYAVMIRVMVGRSEGDSGNFGNIATAIDYDNVNNLGSFTGLQDYSTCVTSQLEPGVSYERFIKPCVAPVVYQSSGTAYSVDRQWINSSNTSVQHYGFRLIFSGNAVSGLTYSVFQSYIIGLRNNI
jgi:hypothetical protein